MSNKRELNSPEFADQLKDLIVSSLERDKAEEITIIDLTDKADFAHYMVIASGRSTRHVSSLADNVSFDIKEEFGLSGLNIEGKQEAKWVLIDALDVIVHIFTQEAREIYSLEKIWGFTMQKRDEA
jgi:ribosome-associated protein